MTSSVLLQFLILLAVMVASGVIGYWAARRHFAESKAATQEDWNKVAETIEQLRNRAMQAEADKARIEHQAEQEREEVRAWYRAQGYAAE